MSPNQTEAISKVRKIMIENFDSWILTHKVVNENLKTAIGHEWHGDISDVVGLTAIAHSRLMTIASNPPGHEVGV